ncbi:MBL fold metallo-hydrolase [Candidatus Bipolaricaulota bacterium]|nr:MBL fold metallo-hydrolase [Candidatus Bipolaricaulota bacterium]
MTQLISADTLKDKQDAGEDFFLLDTRPDGDYEEWHIRGAVNFPHSNGEEIDSEGLEMLRNELGAELDDEIVTVCAKGITSADLADKLKEEGFKDVKTLKNGMRAWSGVYDRVPIATRNRDLVIVQLQRRAKGCLGYLVGSRKSGSAAAFDVSQYVDEFMDAASELGMKIASVFDTHIHADHISGGRQLSRELSVPYHLGSEVKDRDPGFDFEPAESNEVFSIGDLEVKAVHTPGHTTEMTSWLVEGEALISGDSLFVDSIGRTELEFEEEGGKGASLQYRSLLQKVLVLPDGVKILPGHFNVSKVGQADGVKPGAPIFSTIGYLRQNNRALQMDEEEFVEFMQENLPSKPPNYEDIIGLNLGKMNEISEDEAIELELGPNRCAASEDSMVS